MNGKDEMNPECYPMGVLPGMSRLYLDYLEMRSRAATDPMRSWYGADPVGSGWMGRDVAVEHRGRLADALRVQSAGFGAGEAALGNIEKLRAGARAVVTGQQVGLFGGPLLTLLKAATAVARAREATAATGVEHVPVFWLATEDHDLAEVDQVTFPGRGTLEKLTLGLRGTGGPVGSQGLGEEAAGVLEQAAELLGYAPVADLLKECYEAGSTLGEAFAKFMARVFAGHGLIVMDAAGREFHTLGSAVLRGAMERAGELEAALLGRAEELGARGYHAQVLVKPGASLLFLLSEGTHERVALRRLQDGSWKAGTKAYTTGELLGLLAAEPERISPNALLRPVFQDAILPTAAYIGGPAEVAYFAQSAVIYERLPGRLTPVLPRLSATVIDPASAALMARHEVQLDQIFAAGTADALTQRLGARAMPIEGKRRIAAAGNAMDVELAALTSYMGAMDASLGRSAAVSGSKMRYQMNRLRRMAAAFEVQKDASLRKNADAMMMHLFPGGHLQERVLGGAWFLAQFGETLVDRLVDEAGAMCTGHTVIRL